MSESRALNDKFMLRLPDGMRERIKAAAEANNRSMNAEIVAALDTWLDRPSPKDMVQAAMRAQLVAASQSQARVEAELAVIRELVGELYAQLEKGD